MIQIVMKAYVTDGCTFGYDYIQPMLYESLEAVIVDFDIALKQAVAEKVTEFKFAGMEFQTDCFIEHSEQNEPMIKLPDFMTIDEWFKCVTTNATS